MKLIVGLGNPGTLYEFNRHNAGYLVVDKLLERLNLKLNKEKFNGRYVIGDDVIIAKPETYMNRSGFFVQNLLNFYKIDSTNLMVIYDDKDFELGQAAIKIGGSSAGHNGIQSIVDQLGKNDFKRMRIGIGRSDVIPLRDYVLQNFKQEEISDFETVANIACDAAIQFIYNDINQVMEKFNALRRKKNPTGN
ncbi:aminoacyl-tRNA hydrolase [Mycoplasmopsis columbinasalis]|uniref:Peptidyl-tRNA hydrolase n=1 Tax=Mycoplasmopsis columbinasalis TaxID=114880 RepID=A0A449BAA2_9BACT|nr:aminoacyl-tRNA hydrolase [Mycoplasmopsis columbinasalis]VEU78124.1 aminoacyl-tRNA hydrolase [Mycoplasmopsis columbinasalis]